MTPSHDVLIVGGGPAGLSAALILGRCRRRVLLCDAGRPRNARAHRAHGYLTRDCVRPGEFLRLGREELERYPSVAVLRATVVEVELREGVGFEARLEDGTVVLARKLLLATGIVDELPEIEGLDALYGHSVHHCPYCDGWEWRDRPLAVLGKGVKGAGLAFELTNWSRDLVLCTNGPSELDDDRRARLERLRIGLREEPIERLEGKDGLLRCIVFGRGESLAREALFFSSLWHPGSDLVAKLGCSNARGSVETGKHETTETFGLYAAGDASKDLLFVINAASEGATAAYGINTQLIKEDLAAEEAGLS